MACLWLLMACGAPKLSLVLLQLQLLQPSVPQRMLNSRECKSNVSGRSTLRLMAESTTTMQAPKHRYGRSPRPTQTQSLKPRQPKSSQTVRGRSTLLQTAAHTSTTVWKRSQCGRSPLSWQQPKQKPQGYVLKSSQAQQLQQQCLHQHQQCQQQWVVKLASSCMPPQRRRRQRSRPCCRTYGRPWTVSGTKYLPALNPPGMCGSKLSRPTDSVHRATKNGCGSLP